METMLERMICAVLGHRYVIERVLNAGARKVGCTRCRSHWAMHDSTRSFLLWDDELEYLYATKGGVKLWNGNRLKQHQGMTL